MRAIYIIMQNAVTQTMREARHGHKGGVLWFTGLSGAGKTTLSQALQASLFAKNMQVYVLDGDVMRQGLCHDLGFSREDRAENIRRASEVAGLFADAGFIVIAAFISPYHDDRRDVRRATAAPFHNIYIHADVATCEQRDVKGLYKKARAGEISNFTGISAPYEPPASPDLIVDTMAHTIEESVQQLEHYVMQHFTKI